MSWDPFIDPQYMFTWVKHVLRGLYQWLAKGGRIPGMILGPPSVSPSRALSHCSRSRPAGWNRSFWWAHSKALHNVRHSKYPYHWRTWAPVGRRAGEGTGRFTEDWIGAHECGHRDHHTVLYTRLQVRDLALFSVKHIQLELKHNRETRSSVHNHVMFSFLGMNSSLRVCSVLNVVHVSHRMGIHVFVSALTWSLGPLQILDPQFTYRRG